MAAHTRSPDCGEDRDGERTRTIRLDADRDLTYTEYGAESGTPVVFFHGTPGSRRLGALFERDARANDVRLLAFDRPGCGQSSPRPDYSIRDAGQLVTAVLDDAGAEEADLVAFSGGAPHALAAAATLPERVTRVDVVSGATPPKATADQPTVQRLLSGMAARTPRLLGGALRAQTWLARRRDPSFVLAQYTTGEPSGITAEEAEVVRADFLEALADHRSGTVAELRQTATEWRVDFESVSSDVRLWHGSDDTNVPLGDARRFASELDGATLRVVDNADHLQTLLDSVPEILAASQ